MLQYILDNPNLVIPVLIVVVILIVFLALRSKKVNSCPTPRLVLEEMAMQKIRAAFWKTHTPQAFGELCEKIKESTMALADTYDDNKKS